MYNLFHSNRLLEYRFRWLLICGVLYIVGGILQVKGAQISNKTAKMMEAMDIYLDATDLQSRGKTINAIELCKISINIDPKVVVDQYTTLYHLYESTHHYKHANQILLQARNIFPNSVELLKLHLLTKNIIEHMSPTNGE